MFFCPRPLQKYFCKVEKFISICINFIVKKKYKKKDSKLNWTPKIFFYKLFRSLLIFALKKNESILDSERKIYKKENFPNIKNQGGNCHKLDQKIPPLV